MAEKIFIIPLGKEVKKVCSWRKSKRAVREVQRVLLRHLKREIKIGSYLNRYLLQFGRKSAPRRVKIRVNIVEDEGRNFAYAELFDAPMPDFSLDKKETKKEDKKLEEKVENKKIEEKKPAEEIPVKTEEKPAEKKTELKVEDRKVETKPKKEVKHKVGKPKITKSKNI